LFADLATCEHRHGFMTKMPISALPLASQHCAKLDTQECHKASHHQMNLALTLGYAPLVTCSYSQEEKAPPAQS